MNRIWKLDVNNNIKTGGNIKTGYKRLFSSCEGSEHGRVGALFSLFMCFSTRTSALNTFVPLWAGEQSWSLCWDGFGKEVWNWSSRPRSRFALRDVSQASDSKAETARTKSRDGVRESLKTTTNSKRSLSSLSHKTFIVRSKSENGVQKVCGIAVPKAAVVWFFQREAVSSASANLTFLVLKPQES